MTPEEFSQKYGSAAPYPEVPMSWGGKPEKDESKHESPWLDEDHGKGGTSGPSGSGGQHGARPTTDEPAQTRRNPAAATPLTKVATPTSGSSSDGTGFTVVDMRELPCRRGTT